MSGTIVIESHKDPVQCDSKDKPINFGVINTGFPFDDTDFERDRHYSLSSQLDDIANRHPEFAEHLNFGGGGGGGGSFPSRRGFPTTNSTHRRRPFGSTHFDDLDRYFQDIPEYFRESQQPEYQQTPPQKEETVKQQETVEPKVQQTTTQGTQTESAVDNNITTTAPTAATDKPQRVIQQSNTVDLGQKQEPIVEERTQRSMSAPPDNHPPRFVSSINIPINRESGGENMGARASTQEAGTQSHQHPQHQFGQQKPTERVIPIHVEGRDEPVIPKNINSTYTAPPQSERVFTQKPGHFTHYANPEEKLKQQQQQFQRNQGFPRTNTENVKTNFTQPQYQPQQQQQGQYQQQKGQFHQQQQQPPPQHQEDVQEQEEEQLHEEHKPTSLEVIQSIQKDVLELMTQVENFGGKPKDKQYLYLDEMLTRNLIKLDNIETEGKDNIRQARKEAIKCIQSCISILEAKANANVNQTENVAAEQKALEEAPKEEDETASETVTNEPMTLEVSGVVKTGSVVLNNSDNKNNAPMEGVEATQEESKPAEVEIKTEEKVDVKTAEVKPETEEIQQQQQQQPEGTLMEVVAAENEESEKSKEVVDNSSQNPAEVKKEKKKGKKKDKQSSQTDKATEK